MAPVTTEMFVVFGLVGVAVILFVTELLLPDTTATALVVALFYLSTGLLASLVTPVAAVALLLPVTVDAALRLGADPFAFVLAVTFAASTAFLTPIGY